jgi:amino acid adenylation domain-containing protein
VVLPQRQHGEACPLSEGQRALWFLSQLEEGSQAAQLTRALHLAGPLHEDALRSALDRLVERHEVLNTRIALSAGEPIAVISSLQERDLTVEDASQWSRDVLENHLQKTADQPLDLEHGPPVRARLYRCSRDSHVLLLTIHHAVTDFWSLGIMLRDLEELYTSERDQRPARLPPLDLTYRDYARLERQRLSAPAAAELWTFWRQELDGAPFVVEVPSDRARPPVRTFRGAAHSFRIGSRLAAELGTFAKAHSTTLFTVLVASFTALLHRDTGQKDLLVGTPATLRDGSWRDVVGYFTNLLPLRAEFSTDPTFSLLVRQMRSRVLSALAHRDLPFSSLVERLRPDRDASRPPLVQYAFALLGDPSFAAGISTLAAGNAEERLRFSSLLLTHFPISQSFTQFDLAVTLAETNEGLHGSLEYNTDLFDGATARAMAERWQRLLAGVMEQPAMPISRLPLLSPGEREWLLERWNATERSLPHATVHRAFEAIAERWPDVTVSDEASAVTYLDLNRRANRLARGLRRAGVRSETRVALCTSRSLEMLIGALAIMKAGGAYVPLDPAHPPARLGAILADSGARVLVTDRTARVHVPAYDGALVFADESADRDGTELDANLPTYVDSAQAAYVIYTSGSTGTPNGVVVPHRALWNLLRSMQREPGLKAGDRLLSVTTIAFDIAGLELFLPLLSGAHLMIAAQQTAVDGRQLLALMTSWNATLMQATPATWRLLLDSGWNGKNELVALCGGEALTSELGARLMPRCAALWNMYGPTEATIWSMACRVGMVDKISLGRPIDNTQVYLLDEHLEPCPIGVVGEIHIGGEGLARGYWGKPDLTASRFGPNPFSRIPGARLYRTGDRARFRRDGSLEFLGRRDDQVKVRGFRIEPSEIEAAVLQYVDVREAAVVARADERGESTLVAYVVFQHHEPGRLTPGADRRMRQALRTHLAATLPGYMIPTEIVSVAALPRTPNLKVDRRALPQASTALAASSAVDLRNGLEERIANIWREVLHTQCVGPSDNFFDLGGHSLLLNRVRLGVEKLVGYQIPLLEFFRYPTVRTLAAYLQASEPADRGDPGDEPARARRTARSRQQLLKGRRQAQP